MKLSCQPSLQPSVLPSDQPSGQPSKTPSMQPSMQPIAYPTARSSSQGLPTSQPTIHPTIQPATVPTSGPTTAWPVETKTTIIFNSTAKWVVPAGVFTVSLDAFGAQGGDFTDVSGATNRGGLGGHVAATVSVVPGQVLVLSIGSSARRELLSSTRSSINSHIHVTDGSNDKGCSSDMGGYGGDATYLHSLNTITEELSLLMIVGGGGGAGERGSGGSGGGLTAGNGYDTRLNATGTVGYGGNQSAGGLPGGQFPYSGTMGIVGVGGCGQAGGGGGGNGYFGGGGGGQVDRFQGGGGGGGGSSFYANNNVTLHTNVLGANLGNGRIIVTYDTGAPSSSPISHDGTGGTEKASAAGSSDAIVISASLISGGALFLVLGISLYFCGISFSCCRFMYCSNKSGEYCARKSNKIHVSYLDEAYYAMNKDVDCDEGGLAKRGGLPLYFSCHADLDGILSLQGFSYSARRHRNSGILREKPLLSKKSPAPQLSQNEDHVCNNEEDLRHDAAIDAAIDAAFLDECARLTSKYRRKVCDEDKKLAIAKANRKFRNGLESVSCCDSVGVSTNPMSLTYTAEVGADPPPQSPSSFSSNYYLHGEIVKEVSSESSDDKNTDYLAGAGSGDELEYSEVGFLARVWANSLLDSSALNNAEESFARHEIISSVANNSRRSSVSSSDTVNLTTKTASPLRKYLKQNSLIDWDNSSPLAETSNTAPDHLAAASLADLVMKGVTNDEHEPCDEFEEGDTSGNFQLMTLAEKHRRRAQEVRRQLLRATADSTEWCDDSGALVNGDLPESGTSVVSLDTSAAVSLASSSRATAASAVVAKAASPKPSTILTTAGLSEQQTPPTSLAGVTLGQIEELEGDPRLVDANANGMTPEHLSNGTTDLFYRRRMATTNLVLDIEFEGYFDSESTSETESTISEKGF